MIKNIILSLTMTVAIVCSANAGGMVVGNKKAIVAVEEYAYSPSAQRESDIVLVKPVSKGQKIQLVSEDEFLSMHRKEYREVISSLDDVDLIERVVTEKPEIMVVETEKAPKVDIDDIRASEVFVSYDSDKKTLLSLASKTVLEELANKAKEDGSTIGVITYAAGEPALARRVALLRASIIKNTLKGYGVEDKKIDVQSFGNKININQAKVFIVK